jgi:hypothetical protein
MQRQMPQSMSRATLAILVWHFYFVIFDPVVYPMDMTWLTGRPHPGRSLERSSASAHGPAEKAPAPETRPRSGQPGKTKE